MLATYYNWLVIELPTMVGYCSYKVLNQARTAHRPACAWFLKIDPVWIICMRVCVSAPEAINK